MDGFVTTLACVLMASAFLALVASGIGTGPADYLNKLPGVKIDERLVSIDRSVAIGISRSSKVLLVVLPRRKQVLSVSFADIVDCEVSSNDFCVTRTSKGSLVGSALVGAAIAGPIGALIGGMARKQSSHSYIERIAIRFTIASLEIPSHEVVLFSSGHLKLAANNPEILAYLRAAHH